MSGVQVLLVAGTHGNEINAPWLFDQWENNLDFEKISGIKLYRVIGNPLAGKACSRYLDRDLNRSFSPELQKLIGYSIEGGLLGGIQLGEDPISLLQTS